MHKPTPWCVYLYLEKCWTMAASQTCTSPDLSVPEKVFNSDFLFWWYRHAKGHALVYLNNCLKMSCLCRHPWFCTIVYLEMRFDWVKVEDVLKCRSVLHAKFWAWVITSIGVGPLLSKELAKQVLHPYQALWGYGELSHRPTLEPSTLRLQETWSDIPILWPSPLTPEALEALRRDLKPCQAL